VVTRYKFADCDIDSVELKCLLVSRGLKIDREVYKTFKNTHRIYPNALTCNCVLLPDGTVVMATDLSLHLETLSSMFSWENLKLLKYMSEMKTDFRLSLVDGVPTILFKDEVVTAVELLPKSDFYKQKTSSGMPFIGNSVLQGRDWVAFQCLWPCDYACNGKPCQYCFSGGQYEALARKNKPMPFVPSPLDVAEVVKYAIEKDGMNSIQITGGSTFDSAVEEKNIVSYMNAINEVVGRENISGEILLFITPPERFDVIDHYFSLGVDRIICSVEVWDDSRAEIITPGKREFTTKKRHLDALKYIAEKYGPGKAMCNLIVGLESIETFQEGATWLAQNGIFPNASIWMPFGKPVMGSMTPPDLNYFRKVKEFLTELYLKYNLEPECGCGSNTCVERDIWNAANRT
jgi:hypothetical protein